MIGFFIMRFMRFIASASCYQTAQVAFVGAASVMNVMPLHCIALIFGKIKLEFFIIKGHVIISTLSLQTADGPHNIQALDSRNSKSHKLTSNLAFKAI